MGEREASHSEKICSFASEGDCKEGGFAGVCRGLQRAELPANNRETTPENFPQPKELTCVHKAHVPAHEVFRTKPDPLGKTYPR